MSESCQAETGHHGTVRRCLTHGGSWTADEWPDPTTPCPAALVVVERVDAAGSSVRRATSGITVPPRVAGIAAGLPSKPASPGSPKTPSGEGSGGAGSATGKSEPADDPKPSSPSEPPSTPSMTHWREPRTAMEFAGQANRVATMILNGEIDIEKGRLYSSVARTVAQALSTEVSRARYLQNEPNLTFPEDLEDPDA